MSQVEMRDLISRTLSASYNKKMMSRTIAAGVLMAFATGILPAMAGTPKDYSQTTIHVARLLEQGHFTRRKLDENLGREVLKTYLELLDYNKLFFTQEDIAEFEKKYGSRLHRDISSGNLEAAFEIFGRFKQRVEDRVEKNKKLATQKFDFKSNREVEINRQKSPWPANMAEADKLWRDRIEGELLQEKLNEHAIHEPVQAVTRRYDQLLRNVREQEDEDIVKTFLTALAQTYDPHSEYLSARDLENFSIHMKLSLVGVGAVLSSEDGYAKVKEVVPGGPADLDGRLRVNDRITAVAQGNNEFEDVVDMKLDKVVEKIRGEKGSLVRLQIIPADATDPSERRVLDIIRDEVKLREQEAKAEIIDYTDPDGKVVRLGLIKLPSFYAEMGARSADAKSTTKDVAALLERLKKEGIQGLVIDLRRDGGGSLDEAIKLTGLFIPHGPVVQAKDANGKIVVSSDIDPSVVYDGPLVVLMNRMSASASEIFAAALQDYGRAVIVGDERSFGKGTVQTMLEIGKFLPFFSLGASDAGALKLTVQKFYRVQGGSTQNRGVESDIVLPSRTDNPEIGESSLRNPLEYDEVAPKKIDRYAGMLFLDELRERSQERVAKDPEFAYIQEDMQRLRERIEKNSVSLNEQKRRQELAEDKKRREQRLAERKSRKGSPFVAYEVTLENLHEEKLQPVSLKKKDKNKSAEAEDVDEEEEDIENGIDPIKNETVRILRDLVEFSSRKTAAVSHDSSSKGSVTLTD